MEKEIQMKVSDNLEVSVIADETHEFLMTTAEVAKGYGINSATLRSHKYHYQDEFKEGKHFITSVEKINANCKSNGYCSAICREPYISPGRRFPMPDLRHQRERVHDQIETLAHVLVGILALYPDADTKDDEGKTDSERKIIETYRDLESGFFGLLEFYGELLIKEVQNGK